MSLMVHVDAMSGRPMLIPRTKPAGGGGGSGVSRGSFATIVSSDPATGNDGDLIYNTSTAELKIWINGAWVVIGAGEPPTDLATFDFADASDFLFIDGEGFDYIS